MLVCYEAVYVGLGIKSTAGLKTWNGHNAFAHPLKFD